MNNKKSLLIIVLIILFATIIPTEKVYAFGEVAENEMLISDDQIVETIQLENCNAKDPYAPFAMVYHFF